jgi:hypothetical protein
MPKKSKTSHYKGPKRTYIVHHKYGIIPIEEYPAKNLPGYKPKPTLHARGGLIKGKPKLAKKGWK